MCQQYQEIDLLALHLLEQERYLVAMRARLPGQMLRLEQELPSQVARQ
jgi:hypothetical protein